MSYYHRDNEGNWFVRNGAILYPVEYSASMEIAYMMGKIEALDKIGGMLNETTLQIGPTLLGKVDATSLLGG